MKYKIVAVLIFWTAALVRPAWGAESQNFQEHLSRFISEALENNPELLEAKAGVKTAREIPPQAGSLSDPSLAFEIMNLPVDSFSFSREGMTQKQVSLSQKLPFPGKRGLQTQMAQKNVEIMEGGYEDLKLRVVRDVKVSFFELCFALAAIETARENQELLKEFITIAESKYAVGKGIQQDVLKAQVELSQNMEELIQLEKSRNSEQARLNTLMNRLPQAPLTIPHIVQKTPFGYSIEELQKSAEENHPSLKSLKSLAERERSSKRLAQREYYPDFDIGFRYGQRESSFQETRPDMVSAFVGINIPLWSKTKQSRKVAEENFKIEMAQETYKKQRNQIFLQIKEGMDEAAKSQKLLDLITAGIIPQAKQSLESAIAGYTVNKVDFLTLLDNRGALFKWQIKYHRELTEYEKTLAKLEQLAGKSLF